MALRAKLDEDLSSLLAAPLAAHGYEALTVMGQGWGGLVDDLLWPKVAAEHVLFITGDKGFGDIRRFAPGTHDGIVVLRPARESYLDYLRLLENLLASHHLESLSRAITVVTPTRVRIRR